VVDAGNPTNVLALYEYNPYGGGLVE